jgi:tetratricopeptide (TPR) repeat protein
LSTQKALQKLKNTYQNNNEDVEALFEIASIHLSMKQFDEAEAAYNQILALFPDNYESLKQKARIKLNKQQWADAISIYDQLEANYKYEEEFLNNKAIAYIQNGNPQKALEYFEKAIELNPNNKDAIYNRNRLKADMGNRN